MAVILDLQGFIGNNKNFICKEIAVISIRDGECDWEIFAPPYSWCQMTGETRRNVNFLIRHHHNLEWCTGKTQYSDLKKRLTYMVANATLIYVKGLSKMKYLHEILPKYLKYISIKNLEDIECPALEELLLSTTYESCDFHKNHCAVQNVQALHEWFIQRFTKLAALSAFRQKGLLNELYFEEIQCLTKEFVMVYAGEQIGYTWEKFPKSWREDSEFMRYRFCTEHENIDMYRSRMIKDCMKCNEKH